MTDTVTVDALETQPKTELEMLDSGQPVVAREAQLLGLVGATSLLAACGGGGSSSTQQPVLPDPPAAVISQADAARFLLQAQFSASEAEISSVRAVGYASWLQAQITATPGQTGTAWLDSKGYNLPSGGTYFNSAPADYMAWSQLITSVDAPRKRMALALSEILVTSTNTMNGFWPSYLMARYWDLLSNGAFGNYRDLLEAITLNLAMGNYLNTRGNKKADGRGSAPDENYAREVMQLFSLGVVQLNIDGTPKLDASGAKMDTYSNADISELAKVFTGYDTDNSQNVNTSVPRAGGGTDNVPSNTFTQLPMVQTQNGRFRATGTANFLGVTVADVSNVSASLKTALDTLFNHPNHAPFISKQLIQRLVTSNPSPAYVQRIATVYANNGKGVRGDLGAVYAAILQDPEARGPAGLNAPEFGKLREPMLRFVQWARTFNVSSISGDWKVGDLSDAGTRLGQSPLRAPSVFNFFRPGYVPEGSSLSAGAVAPEFQLVNESSVAGYLNYMQGVIDAGLNASDIKAAYTAEIALAESPTAAAPSNLVNRLNLLMAAGQLSAATVKLITDAVGLMKQTEPASATNTATNLRRRVCAAVLMVMASSEYLVQK